MKSIVVRAFGPPDVMRVEETPDAVPGPAQVLVRVRAIGVNPVETYVRAGAYARKPELPYVPGSDAAGIVDAVGAAVKEFSPGDRVYTSGASPLRLNGAYSERMLCEVAQVHRLPGRVTFQQGAALGVPYATAYRALVQRGRAEAGEWLLVHGASGGVGTAAVQLARALGLRVVGTAGTEAGMELVRSQGAHYALNHREPEYLQRVLQLTDGRGVSLVLEMLANVNLERDLTVLAVHGRIVVVGNRGTIEIDPRKVMAREATVLGMQLAVASSSDLARIHAGIAAGLENGTLEPVVGREIPLVDAPAAHEAVMAPGARGKIILIP